MVKSNSVFSWCHAVVAVIAVSSTHFWRRPTFLLSTSLGAPEDWDSNKGLRENIHFDCPGNAFSFFPFFFHPWLRDTFVLKRSIRSGGPFKKRFVSQLIISCRYPGGARLFKGDPYRYLNHLPLCRPPPPTGCHEAVVVASESIAHYTIRL